MENDMDEKLCPKLKRVTYHYYGDHIQATTEDALPCLREKCEWWIPASYSTEWKTEGEHCAILAIARRGKGE